MDCGKIYSSSFLTALTAKASQNAEWEGVDFTTKYKGALCLSINL
jgi:hypothetical protein